MTIENRIIILLKKAPRYFNELRRLLDDPSMEIYATLIRMEKAGKVKSEMVHSSFEEKNRWVRQYSLTGAKK